MVSQACGTLRAVIDASHARRFMVRRHLLAPPRALPPEPASVLAVARRFGSLQFDPLDVPGARNHEAVLHARIAGFQKSWCEQHLYGPPGSRTLIELWNKSLNLVPVEDLPAHRHAWSKATVRHAAGILSKRPAVAEAILNQVRAAGETGTRAMARSHGNSVDWYWAPTSEGRAVAEALFETGQIGIARREGNHRVFDLIERLHPTLAAALPPAEAERARLLSRHRAVGLMGAGGGAELFTGLGKSDVRAKARRALLDDGTLVPVAVEGVRGERYVLASEGALLDACATETAPLRGVTLLAPLDPFVWDRALLRDLFGFDYRWEVYTPAHLRRYGYYALPLLWGDRVVGRVEPVRDRARRKVTVRGLWFEEGFDPLAEEGFVDDLAEALEAWRRFVDADELALPRTKVGRRVAERWRALGAAG
jgi:uncharacterized protein YcaQ